MPTYDNTPFSFPELLIGGKPGYAFGSLPTGPTCRMIITSDSVASNVVTLGVRIVEGNIPSVGDLIYTYATANSAGALNQTTGIAIASVNITAATGIGTITFAKTVGNQGTTSDSGYALSEPAEVGETLTSGMKSKAFAIQNRPGGGYGITWAYTFPSQPAAATIQLEGAINDNDSEYTLIGTAQTTVSGYNEIFATVPELVNFVRLRVPSSSGGSSPTVIGKVLNA